MLEHSSVHSFNESFSFFFFRGENKPIINPWTLPLNTALYHRSIVTWVIQPLLFDVNAIVPRASDSCVCLLFYHKRSMMTLNWMKKQKLMTSNYSYKKRKKNVLKKIRYFSVKRHLTQTYWHVSTAERYGNKKKFKLFIKLLLNR